MAATRTAAPPPSNAAEPKAGKKAAAPRPARAAAAPPAAKSASPARNLADGGKDAKDAKVRKPKLVRDSFTIPKDEYAVVETLKQRAAVLAHPVKKSELLRAGLKLLASLPDAALRSALQAVPSIKTGRPRAQDDADADAQAAPVPAPAAAPARESAPLPAKAGKPAAKARRK